MTACQISFVIVLIAWAVMVYLWWTLYKRLKGRK